MCLPIGTGKGQLAVNGETVDEARGNQQRAVGAVGLLPPAAAGARIARISVNGAFASDDHVVHKSLCIGSVHMRFVLGGKRTTKGFHVDYRGGSGVGCYGGGFGVLGSGRQVQAVAGCGLVARQPQDLRRD